MKTRSVEKLGWVVFRGGLLGVCHLSVYQTILDFIAHPLDPLGTKMVDANLKTKEFLFSGGKDSKDVTEGDRILTKLYALGYFKQRQEKDPLTQLNQIESRGVVGENGENPEQFVNILFASIATSVVIALVMTPFDMVFFKMIAKTANMTSKASFS